MMTAQLHICSLRNCAEGQYAGGAILCRRFTAGCATHLLAVHATHILAVHATYMLAARATHILAAQATHMLAAHAGCAIIHYATSCAGCATGYAIICWLRNHTLSVQLICWLRNFAGGSYALYAIQGGEKAAHHGQRRGNPEFDFVSIYFRTVALFEINTHHVCIISDKYTQMDVTLLSVTLKGSASWPTSR